MAAILPIPLLTSFGCQPPRYSTRSTFRQCGDWAGGLASARGVRRRRVRQYNLWFRQRNT